MKYEITDIVHPENPKLKRIRALKDFYGVRALELGGWIESETNLSQDGTCWVSGDAKVSGNARVYGNAKVGGNSWVSGDAWVGGNSWVSGDAWVGGNAWVSDNAEVYGNFMGGGDSKTDKSVYQTIVLDGIEYNLVPK